MAQTLKALVVRLPFRFLCTPAGPSRALTLPAGAPSLQLEKHPDAEIKTNDAEALKTLSPTGTWRRGAFEVTNDSKEVLYSKLWSGNHLIGSDERVAAFLAKLE